MFSWKPKRENMNSIQVPQGRATYNNEDTGKSLNTLKPKSPDSHFLSKDNGPSTS